MVMNKKLAALINESKKDDLYWVEEAKLGFALSLEKQRKSSGLSYSELAKRIKTSAAYITKVFRGDSNMTIESMVKLARASGGKLNIEIINESVGVKHWGKVIPLAQRAPVPNTTSATIIQFNSIPTRNTQTEIMEAA